jgi:hypothetical protein
LHSGNLLFELRAMNRALYLSLFVALTSLGHAQVLIDEQFTQGTANSPVGLDGKAPTYSSSLVTEHWMADSSLTENGTEASIPYAPSTQAIGYLAIPGASSGLVVGNTYTLSFTLGPVSGGSWTSAGFGTETSTSNVTYTGSNYGGFWVLNNGGAIALYANSSNGVPNQIGGVSITGGVGNVTLSIAVGATSDTLSALVNGNPVTLSDSTFSLAPVTEVFIGHYEAAGTFSDLVLTAPEPSTWAMMLLGAAGLLVIGRRRALRV